MAWIDLDNEGGPMAILEGDGPPYPRFSIRRDDGRDAQIDMLAEEAMIVGLAMIAWAKSQGVNVPTKGVK